MSGTAPRVVTGLDTIASERFARLRGRKVGLIANQSTVDHRFRHAIDLLHEAPDVELVRLFSPEHGLRGEAQDMIGVGSAHDRRTGLPVVSLYGDSPESLRPSAADLDGIDCLVFDLQDVGARYYTFFATLCFAMEVAAEVGCSVLVLDRPNPIGGIAVEGPTVQPGFESFVGVHPMPIRHGMTVGELALLYRSDRAIDLDLDIVPCSGWTRGMYWAETGLTWVPPSPNMPTADTTLVYPGGCLIEGTNLSEGRGTTRPFEFWGAPWLEDATARMIETLGERPGTALRSIAFRPVFHKHAGLICHGIQPHVVNPIAFSALETYLVLLLLAHRADPERFAWRTEPYEFVALPIAIDLLFGSFEERQAIEEASGQSQLDLADWLAAVVGRWAADVQEFIERRRPSLRYPDTA